MRERIMPILITFNPSMIGFFLAIFPKNIPKKKISAKATHVEESKAILNSINPMEQMMSGIIAIEERSKGEKPSMNAI